MTMSTAGQGLRNIHRHTGNSLDTLVVAVTEISSNYEAVSSEGGGAGQMSTVAPMIPESLIVATKIRRGRPKRSEQESISETKQAALVEGYRQLIDQIAHDASEDSSGRRRQFVCTVSGCGKVFYQRAHLNIHIRSHTGYKPYACQYPGCGKSFPQLGNMRTHERIHTGDRPFNCEVPGCEKAFTQRGNLKTHLKKVHGMGYISGLSRTNQKGTLSQHKAAAVNLPSPILLASEVATPVSPTLGHASLVNSANGETSDLPAPLPRIQPNQHQQTAHQQVSPHALLPASILASAKLPNQ
ncbi:hypothetical protein GGI25_002095 [Coemansia spiralis]|uniref:C2H2-type domain-containing protein n=2 Tax=Coemansia TaxID=4863 RepID=A0A9W8GB80_9FUNG|nr:hypothetical protein EDC05_005472 [Coemansia umbellata]KAJ2625577.1 hypothetical protein GGI26_000376 [Coemansia sp. RSA 1358]KAJ2678711.1 hypothetical protein GGI25_002095 [Coemansia spiralis]